MQKFDRKWSKTLSDRFSLHSYKTVWIVYALNLYSQKFAPKYNQTSVHTEIRSKMEQNLCIKDLHPTVIKPFESWMRQNQRREWKFATLTWTQTVNTLQDMSELIFIPSRIKPPINYLPVIFAGLVAQVGTMRTMNSEGTMTTEGLCRCAARLGPKRRREKSKSTKQQGEEGGLSRDVTWAELNNSEEEKEKERCNCGGVKRRRNCGGVRQQRGTKIVYVIFRTKLCMYVRIIYVYDILHS